MRWSHTRSTGLSSGERQRQQRDGAGNAQRAGTVPAGLIEQHGDVLVIADGRSEAVEEHQRLRAIERVRSRNRATE